MEHSSSAEPLGARRAAQLLDLAEESIRRALAGEGPLRPDPDTAPPPLREVRGVFVTVTVDGALNGCTGVLDPTEPVVVAVPRLAWSAAFRDPRLPALTAAELPRTGVKVSLLSALEPLAVRSEAELLGQLRPGVDGLVVVAGERQATFLPAVWASLPEPGDFVRHLFDKAGLPPRRWPAGATFARYTVEEVSRDERRVPRPS